MCLVLLVVDTVFQVDARFLCRYSIVPQPGHAVPVTTWPSLNLPYELGHQRHVGECRNVLSAVCLSRSLCTAARRPLDLPTLHPARQYMTLKTLLHRRLLPLQSSRMCSGDVLMWRHTAFVDLNRAVCCRPSHMQTIHQLRIAFCNYAVSVEGCMLSLTASWWHDVAAFLAWRTMHGSLQGRR